MNKIGVCPWSLVSGRREKKLWAVDIGCFIKLFSFSLVDGGGVLDLIDGIGISHPCPAGHYVEMSIS